MTADEIMALIRVSDKPHYVYVLKRPCGEPFYVGAGTGSRIFDHEIQAHRSNVRGHRAAIIRKFQKDGHRPSYEIAGWFDQWSNALEEEVRLIARYGRNDLGLGPLTNLTDGGEGQRGIIRSPETREKLRRAHSGKVVSLETRDLLRRANLGKKQSPERIEKRAAKQRGRAVSDETRAKLSAANKRRLALLPPKPPKIKPPKEWKPRKSRGPCSPELKEKIAAAQRGKPKAEISRAAMSVSQRARFERHRAEGGLKLPHHKNSTPEGRAKYRRPIEINGVRYEGTDCAVTMLGVGKTTINRWLQSGHHGARRLEVL